MGTTSIWLAGVGGQGLVLTTRILTGVAFREGWDVKATDVVGLAQRGGKVWGTVRFGTKVHSPLISRGQGDFLLSFEDLEGLRWMEFLKPAATIIMGRDVIFPNRVLLEKEEYPDNVVSQFRAQGFRVTALPTKTMAKELGNARLANTILLGNLSRHLSWQLESWEDVISQNVPPKTIEGNLKAFAQGRKLVFPGESPPEDRG